VNGVVLDTNIYISALVFGGIPRQVLNQIHSGAGVLYVSPFIIDELTGTLSEKFGWSRRELAAFLPPLWARCVVIKPEIRLKVCKDPDDDYVLECAVSAGARFLVTGNTKHFPREYGSTRVLTPREFLHLLT
jgi:uncharacterized protein